MLLQTGWSSGSVIWRSWVFLGFFWSLRRMVGYVWGPLLYLVKVFPYGRRWRLLRSHGSSKECWVAWEVGINRRVVDSWCAGSPKWFETLLFIFIIIYLFIYFCLFNCLLLLMILCKGGVTLFRLFAFNAFPPPFVFFYFIDVFCCFYDESNKLEFEMNLKATHHTY